MTKFLLPILLLFAYLSVATIIISPVQFENNDPDYYTGAIPPDNSQTDPMTGGLTPPDQTTPDNGQSYQTGAIVPPEQSEQSESHQYSMGLIVPDEEEKPQYSTGLIVPEDEKQENNQYSTGLIVPEDEKEENYQYSTGLIVPKDKSEQKPQYSTGLIVPKDEKQQKPQYSMGLIVPEDEKQQKPKYSMGLIKPGRFDPENSYSKGLIVPEDEKLPFEKGPINPKTILPYPEEQSSQETQRYRTGLRRCRGCGRLRRYATSRRFTSKTTSRRSIILIDNIGTNKFKSAIRKFRLRQDGPVTVSFIAYTFATRVRSTAQKALLGIQLNGVQKVIQLGSGITKVNLSFNGKAGLNVLNFQLSGAGLSQGKVQTTLTLLNIKS